MGKFLRSILISLAFRLLRYYRGAALQQGKIEAAKLYVKGVATTRNTVLATLSLVFLVVLFSLGFGVFHVGLFVFLPLEIPTKGLLFLVLGVVYTAIPIVIIAKMMSERAWMEASRAGELVQHLAESKAVAKQRE